MSWDVIRLDEIEPTAWRNGGGMTRELVTWPEPDRWAWRMSVATIERDGPFSRYPEMRRWFAVVGGAGVRLEIDGARHELTQTSDPLSFDGSVATSCTLLAGTTEDFNLMVRGGAAAGSMRRVRKRAEAHVSATKVIAIYSIGARCSARFGNEKLDLPARTLAWRVAQQVTEVQVLADDALWMEIAQ